MHGPSRDYMESVRAANRQALGMAGVGAPLERKPSGWKVLGIGLALGLLAWWTLAPAKRPRRRQGRRR